MSRRNWSLNALRSFVNSYDPPASLGERAALAALKTLLEGWDQLPNPPDPDTIEREVSRLEDIVLAFRGCVSRMNIPLPT